MENAALEKEVAELTTEKTKLEQAQRQVEKERAEVSAEKAVLDRSVAVWQKAVRPDVSIAIEGPQIVLTNLEAGAEALRDVVHVEMIDPSLVPLLSKVQILKDAEGRFDRLLGDLEVRRNELADRDPDRKEALREDQAEDKRTVDRMWAELADQGKGR